ncbi:hypothetical protein GCM10027569_69990 [Flindersiella endophytica]
MTADSQRNGPGSDIGSGPFRVQATWAGTPLETTLLGWSGLTEIRRVAVRRHLQDTPYRYKVFSWARIDQNDVEVVR